MLPRMPLKSLATAAIVLALLAQGGAAMANPVDDRPTLPEPLVITRDDADGAQQLLEAPEPEADLDMQHGVQRAPEPERAAASAPEPRAAWEAENFALLNQLRVQKCVPILNRTAGLDKVARNWSTTMAKTGDFNHNPNMDQQAPGDWNMLGENIAAGYMGGGAMFEGWKNSPGHYGNMIMPEFTSVGIGMVVHWGGPGGYGSYGTQLFAAYPEEQGGRFLDVRPFSRFFTEIEWMGSSGLSTGNKVKGCAAGTSTYNPKQNTSREAMAAFLYRFKEADYKGPKVSPFADVKPGDKFYDQITWMYKEKLSTGTKQPSGKPKFEPKSNVSREAMAAFMYRLNKATYKGTAVSPFADVKPGQKFYDQITWMHAEGLSTGTKQPTGLPKYLPYDMVTREAMAAFIYRQES